ncbi:hypothetical protein GKZ68_10520 [Hymenobacter sp. BRD128]|uniref:hypothetical protein n=1 Tax=Hymenobacter sp. BRD128 TaxID=2675878 RepID=UPI001565D123|nr:hypothetical protein [Hymenobacter sp. BRD128]QKG57023.1 hypothetical protein GKZ68_10520 [Hymenobacter sp. BRD128]
MNRILDSYLRHSLKCDIAISIVIVGVLHFWAGRLPLSSFERGSVISSLAGTAVSLAGFILAALTIIVTFRANVASKGIMESMSGMEIIFNGPAYRDIVGVFKGAIIGLVICTLVLYLGMIFGANLPLRWISLLSVVGLIEIILSITRCLYILFRVVEIDFKK